jgi:8-oxo-dGTP pyrophosphatase MutT (NUDIX family)
MNEFKENLKKYKKEPKKAVEIKEKEIYYYVYDENKNKVGKIKSDYEKFQNLWLKGVAVFVLTKDGMLILEKRAATTKLTPNLIDLCSGHRDNKEKGKQTPKRELKEELGIKKKKIKKIKRVEREIPLIFGNDRKFYIQFYVAKTKIKSIKKLQKEEVENIIKVHLQEGFNMIRRGETKFPYKGNEQYFEKLFEEVEKFIEKTNSRKIKGEEK